MAIPLLLVGDGPQEPTGLGRIARDLAANLTSSALPFDLVQVGGEVPPAWTAWRHLPLSEAQRGEDWGAEIVRQYYDSLWGRTPGILWLIWDPSRLYPYTQIDLPVQRWAYPAVDAANIHGRFGGPAGQAIQQFDRILGYGRWGAEILQTVRGEPVSYLPHGLSTSTYSTYCTEEESQWVDETFGPHAIGKIVLGCVATNQPRKDLSLFFGTIAELRRRGWNVYGWLHTDTLVKAWSIGELVDGFGLQRQVTVTLDTFSDRQLACLYQRCGATIAPALGEGFGYPIVESLASGIPVIHGDSGGGAELIPKTEWRVPRRAERMESIYALIRPVFTVTDFANATERALRWRQDVGEAVCRAYCQGAVAHLDWSALWPRWESWIRKGIQ